MDWNDIVDTPGFQVDSSPEKFGISNYEWRKYKEKWEDNINSGFQEKSEKHRKFILGKLSEIQTGIKGPETLVPRFLEDDEQMVFSIISTLEKRVQRKREIQKFAALSVWDQALPDPGDVHQVEDKKRKERLDRLYTSFEKIWDDAVYCYIEGHYFASVVSMASLLEAVLKFKMEIFNLDTERVSLNHAIRKLQEEGYFETATPDPNSLIHKLEEIKDIRNDVIHLNAERGTDKSQLASKEGFHESELFIEYSERSIESIMKFGDNVSIEKGDYFNPSELKVTYMYKNAAKEVITLSYECLEIINSRKGVFGQ